MMSDDLRTCGSYGRTLNSIAGDSGVGVCTEDLVGIK